MAIRHVVLFRLVTDDPTEKAAQIAEADRRLGALVGVIPGLRSLGARANALDDDRNSDYVIVGDFDGLDAVRVYATHPAHLEFIAFMSPLNVGSSRAAVDFEI
ncbi:MAG: Dabb family protein [Microbacterium sp.]